MFYIFLNYTSMQYKLDRRQLCNSPNDKVVPPLFFYKDCHSDGLYCLYYTLGVQVKSTAIWLFSQRGFWEAYPYSSSPSNCLLNSTKRGTVWDWKLHLNVLLVTWYHTRTGSSSGKWSNPGTDKTSHKNTWLYTYQGEEITPKNRLFKKQNKTQPPTTHSVLYSKQIKNKTLSALSLRMGSSLHYLPLPVFKSSKSATLNGDQSNWNTTYTATQTD